MSMGVLFLHASSYSFFRDFLARFAVFMASLIIFCFLFVFILIDPVVDSSDFMIAFSSVLYILSTGVILSHMFCSFPSLVLIPFSTFLLFCLLAVLVYLLLWLLCCGLFCVCPLLGICWCRRLLIRLFY